MKNSTPNKIKVLHLISGDLWAGAEVMAFNLIRSLSESSDLDISIILLNEGKLAEELRNCGLEVHVIDERSYSFWKIFRKALELINENRPDIIHAHRYKENLLALFISKSCRRIKLIATQHGLPEITGANISLVAGLKSKLNFHILSRYFAKTVAVSNDIRNTLISRFGFADECIEVIHNGIHLPPSPSYPKLIDRPFVIGSSGRLFPVKDYPLMVEIAHNIATSGKANIRFELAGDGPERTQLENLIRRDGLQENFILKGHQDDMDSFYLGLNIYINTSVHEGIPMTILEAMAHGLPVIAPAVGGIIEIIEDDSEGYLIAGRYPHDFAEKCLLLYEDVELRKRMSKAARERAELAFSAENMARGYYRIYQMIIQ